MSYHNKCNYEHPIKSNNAAMGINKTNSEYSTN